MPNGQSMIGAAGTMVLDVSKALGGEIQPSVLQHQKHLESRRAHLESLLGDSHQSDVREMIAELSTSIEALTVVAGYLPEAAEGAAKIEARL